MCRRDGVGTRPSRPRRRRDAAAVPRPRPLLREGASGQVVRGRRDGRRIGRAARHVHQRRRAEAVRALDAGGGRPPGADRRRRRRPAGRGPDGTERYDRLERFLQEPVPVSRPNTAGRRTTTSRSTGCPTIGRLLPGDERVSSTGFAKWGMTKGDARRDVLTDAVRGRPNEYADLYSGHTPRRAAIRPRFATENRRVEPAFVRPRKPRDGRVRVGRARAGGGTVCRIGEALRGHRDGRRPSPLALGPLSPPGLHRRLERRRPGVGMPCHGSRLRRRRVARAGAGGRGSARGSPAPRSARRGLACRRLDFEVPWSAADDALALPWSRPRLRSCRRPGPGTRRARSGSRACRAPCPSRCRRARCGSPRGRSRLTRSSAPR